eukprot:m.134857 g.134857  ORF g.134857 m.134857 type:complete len:1046 (-) comp14854_c0_seq4:70-3207(-)
MRFCVAALSLAVLWALPTPGSAAQETGCLLHENGQSNPFLECPTPCQRWTAANLYISCVGRQIAVFSRPCCPWSSLLSTHQAKENERIRVHQHGRSYEFFTRCPFHAQLSPASPPAPNQNRTQSPLSPVQRPRYEELLAQASVERRAILGTLTHNIGAYCNLSEFATSDDDYGSVLGNIYTAHCSYRNFSLFPTLPSNLEAIHFDHNMLTTLTPGLLQSFSNLTLLFLKYNRITAIAPQAFLGLSALTVLDLGGNMLTSITINTFSGLSALQYLSLHNNGVVTLSPLAFGPLLNVEYLSLNTNHISALPATLFWNQTKLVFLDLGSNLLSSIPDSIFDEASSLQRVNISYNLFREIDARFFSFFPPKPFYGWVQGVCMQNSYFGTPCPASTAMLSIHLFGNPLEQFSKTAFDALPVSVVVVVARNDSILSLPSPCGLTWLYKKPQVQGLNYITTPSGPLTFDSTMCPCKQLAYEQGMCLALFNYTLFNGTCVSTGCPPGYLLNPSSNALITCTDPAFVDDSFMFFETLCEACFVSNCYNCNKSVFSCSQCNPGLLLLEESSCVTKCPSGYFADNGVCMDCGTHCQQCSGIDSCSVCDAGYSVTEGTCVRCQQPSCMSCPNSYQVCTACNPGVLINGVCYPTAPQSSSSGRDVSSIVAGVVVGVIGLALLILLIVWRRLRRATSQLSHRLLTSQEEVMALRRTWEIHPDDVELLNKIGFGNYGDVFRGLWRDILVAVKRLPDAGANSMSAGGDDGNLEQEIGLLQTIRHPNIVLFFGCGTFPDGSSFLVTELLELGSLRHVLDEPPRLLTWEIRKRFARDTAAGMAHLHSLARMHRDLKSPNLLVSASLRVKVADFGTATLFRNLQIRASRRQRGRGPWRSDKRTKSTDENYDSNMQYRLQTKCVGTPLWMAPEVIAGEQYGLSADVFSFGVVMWEIASQELPWNDITTKFLLNTLLQRLRDEIRPPIQPDWPAAYVSLMTACWATTPTARPAFAEILQRLLDMEVFGPASAADPGLSGDTAPPPLNLGRMGSFYFLPSPTGSEDV